MSKCTYVKTSVNQTKSIEMRCADYYTSKQSQQEKMRVYNERKIFSTKRGSEKGVIIITATKHAHVGYYNGCTHLRACYARSKRHLGARKDFNNG